MPKSLICLMIGYLGVLGFVAVYCHVKPGHPVKADERVLHRIAP